ncbi:MAG: ComF family protein [Epsilonproteobacteria bacterium]|nr:ComF family protein [Campylobacterota bacterium]
MMLQIQQRLFQVCSELHAIIAPPRCTGCTSLLVERAVLCTPCNQSIQPVVSLSLSITQRSVISVYAVGAYRDILRRLICAKHTGNQLAGTYLGDLVWYRTPLAQLECDYIIPVPLHWTRRFVRGFNQTDEMAQALSRKSGKPVAHLLQRTKRTAFQTSLSASDRQQNLTDAFVLSSSALRDSRYAGKHLVLVDDLMTTGATLRIACQQLLKLKPASIVCVVAARTV